MSEEDKQAQNKELEQVLEGFDEAVKEAQTAMTTASTKGAIAFISAATKVLNGITSTLSASKESETTEEKEKSE